MYLGEIEENTKPTSEACSGFMLAQDSRLGMREHSE